MEPKQQVNRIAKNMIELTYGATLAELTSLEEMMRTMMEDDQIHGRRSVQVEYGRIRLDRILE